jgi:uncharacterized surface protein with fasciclin (FAS1) repeats
MLQSIKSIQKILGITIATGTLIWGSLALAQGRPFFFPSASFFSPQAGVLESGGGADILTILKETGQNQQFYSQLQSSEVSKEVGGKYVTVLAPTDKAFDSLPADVRAKLKEPAKLEQLLKYHFIAGEITEDDIKRQAVPTLLEQTSVSIIGIPVGDRVGVKLNDATATQPLKADDGVIVTIDRVLIPPGF